MDPYLGTNYKKPFFLVEKVYDKWKIIYKSENKTYEKFNSIPFILFVIYILTFYIYFILL